MRTADRQRLRQWVLDWWGDGQTCKCVGCDTWLDNQTLTLDRYPVPGKFGGTYRRNNVRPMCYVCNHGHNMEPELEDVYAYMEMWGIEWEPGPSNNRTDSHRRRKQEYRRQRRELKAYRKTLYQIAMLEKEREGVTYTLADYYQVKAVNE